MTQKTLSVKLELLTQDFAKNLDKSVKGVLDSTKKMTKNIQSLGSKMSVAIALPATLIGKSLLKMAGDAEDANDKFSAIFGESAPKVEKAIDNLSKVFTRNATDLKNYASEFGSMLTSMDLTEAEAGSLSRSMVQLGLDVASLRGISDAKVMDAFTASLTGNVRGLKQLGISISDTDIENEAFLLGIGRSSKEFTERDKALIMASLLQKNFKKDIGDASKSQNDWGEVMNQFNAKIKTMAESFGKELIPQVVILIDKILPLITAFSELDSSTKEGLVSILILSAILPPIITGLSTFGNGVLDLAKAFWGLISAIMPAILSIVTFLSELTIVALTKITIAIGLFSAEIAILTKALIAPVVIFGSLALILRALVKLIGFFTIAFGDYAQEITRAVIPVTLALLKSWEGLTYAMVYAKNAMKGHQEASNQARIATEGLRQSQKDLAETFVNGAPTELGNKIQKSMHESGRAIEQFTDDVDSFFLFIPKKLGSVMDTTVSIMKSKSDELASSLKNSIVTGAVEGAKGLGDMLKTQLKDIVKMIGSFKPFEHLKPKKDFFSEWKNGWKNLIDFFKENPIDISKMVKPEEMPTFPGVGKTPTADLRQGEDTNLLPKIPEGALSLWDDFAKHIEETMITTSDVVKGVWDNVFNGFASGISGMILEGNSFAETFKNMFKSLADFVIQSIIKMGLQWLVTEMMKRAVSSGTSKVVQADAITTATVATTASVTSSETMIANNAVVAGSGAASSQASVPFIGPILAVAAMGAMIATVMALQGKLKLASGGVTQGPTNALIGEKGKEAVIPLDRLDSMMGNKEQVISVNLDGRMIARTVAHNMPRELRIETGITI
jgi:hypothetical protein